MMVRANVAAIWWMESIRRAGFRSCGASPFYSHTQVLIGSAINAALRLIAAVVTAVAVAALMTVCGLPAGEQHI